MSKTISQAKAASKRIIPNWPELDKYVDVNGISERDFAGSVNISWTLYWNLRKYNGMDLPVPNKMMIGVMELTGWPFERCFLIVED